MEVNKVELYSNYIYRLTIAKKLLGMNDEILKGGVLFENLEQIKEKIEVHNYEDETVLKFILNHLIENVRITAFFENFLKAFLLLNNKVVHLVNSDLEDLNKRQKKSPIDISEIKDYATDLTEKTIGIPYLKKQKYCKEVNLEYNLMKSLFSIFNYRNNIHFHIGETLNDPKGFIDLYEKVLKVSEKNISPTIKQIETAISDLVVLNKIK